MTEFSIDYSDEVNDVNNYLKIGVNIEIEEEEKLIHISTYKFEYTESVFYAFFYKNMLMVVGIENDKVETVTFEKIITNSNKKKIIEQVLNINNAIFLNISFFKKMHSICKKYYNKLYIKEYDFDNTHEYEIKEFSRILRCLKIKNILNES